MNSTGEWTNPGEWISCLFGSQIPSRKKLHFPSIRTRKNRRNGIDHHSDGSTEPPEKKDDHHDDEYIEFCFKQDGEFEVVSDIAPQPTAESTKEEGEEGEKQSDSKRSDGGSSVSSDGSFSFPVLKWGEMVGSPVPMPKAEAQKQEEELQLRKQRINRGRFRQCWRL